MSHARGSKALKKHRDAKLLRKRRRNQYKGYPTFEIKRGYSPRQRENTMHYILDGLGSWRNVYAPVVGIDALVAWLKIKNPKAPAVTRAIDGTF
jgi:hypothetical protein